MYEPSYLHTQVVHGVELEICTSAYEVVVVLHCKVHHPQAVLEPGVRGRGVHVVAAAKLLHISQPKCKIN